MTHPVYVPSRALVKTQKFADDVALLHEVEFHSHVESLRYKI